MFDFTKSIEATQNMHARAMAAFMAHRLYEGEPPTALESVQGDVAENVRMPYASRQTVAVRCWRGQGAVVVGLSGLTFINDGTDFLAGAAVLREMEGIAGKYNSMAVRWSNVIYAMIRNLVVPGITKMWLFGHSMGGTQACIVGKFVKRAFPNLDVKVISYGSPSWCNADGASEMGDIVAARIMNNGDFVPYIVPNPMDNPTLFAALPVNAINNLINHCHIQRGIRLAGDGTMTLADTPIGLLAGFDWSPQAIVFGLIGRYQEHNIAIYADRLARAMTRGVDNVQPLHNVPDVVPPNRRPPVVPRAEIERAARRNDIFEDRPAIAPWVEQVPGRIRTRKVEGHTIVFIDDRPLYVGATHGDALAVARAARRMCTQYVQEPTRFIGAGSLDELFMGELGQVVDEDEGV